MKAIETKYNGYRFRSRLEARWALFFGVQLILYEYEPEGYILSDGTWYLPDFWLPQVKMWAEVKPVELTEKENLKCKLLAEESGYPCLMLIGPPNFINYDAWVRWKPRDNITELVDYSLVDTYLPHERDEGRFPCFSYCRPGSCQDYPDIYLLAVDMSRSARFEHGESGYAA